MSIPIDATESKETNPAVMMESGTGLNNDSNPGKSGPQASSTEQQQQQDKPSHETRNSDIHGDNHNNVQETKPNTDQSDGQKQESSDQKNDSSTLSTAFTISFEDETASTKKLFGIRDSIRKFAPPKPNTIEKPRPSKSDNQDSSYMSIESAPGGFNRTPNLRRDVNNSCRSSGRKSDSSSRHSAISESAAFLIDKMLNCKSEFKSDTNESPLSNYMPKKSPKREKDTRPKDRDPLEDEIDFSEDKSDNGTYIVGTDPESDAARKKIDELFGVVKAAEASLLAAESSFNSRSAATATTTISTNRSSIRPSRAPDKKAPFSKERQEHIDRLATGRNSSRSSSSSRQDTIATRGAHLEARQRSRNSSCDRLARPQVGRPRRATSQSSRQSSNRDASDLDTRSSRSSLHHDVDIICDSQASNNPSMKFNRAFALRRARLGLGEPMQRIPTAHSSNLEPVDTTSASINSSPRRRLQASSGTHRSGAAGGSTPQSLSRTDGGRFSLRMKNSNFASRLASNQAKGTHHGTIIDSYVSKISGSKVPSAGYNPSSLQQQQQQQQLHLNSGGGHHPYTSTNMPYQSSDELEATTSSASKYKSLINQGRLSQRRMQAELESDADSSSNNRFNYSLNVVGLDGTGSYGQQQQQPHQAELRASSSTGKRGSSVQLGALDSLVISAISSLSLKIRSSVCDLMVDHAKRLPMENETRLVVEEILPQLATANSSRPKSPTSLEEIDQSLYFDLAQTLKNLKKVEQMVDVMSTISNQLPYSPTSGSLRNSNSKSSSSGPSGTTFRANNGADNGRDSNTNSEANSLSPV